MPSVPREKYPEMNWRAADKVAAWRAFKQRMNVIFVADQVPEERQWALILVAGGDEAYNRWDTLEERVEDHKKKEQVWEAFEKSFEQSTSFWHFRDTNLADFRQDKSETTADLDLCIKQTVRGYQWKKEAEEERMIDLLYHATIYYKIRKFVQESDPAALTYEMVIEKAKAHERNVLEYKDHQASHGGAKSAPSYNNPLLSAHALSKRWPSRLCRSLFLVFCYFQKLENINFKKILGKNKFSLYLLKCDGLLKCLHAWLLWKFGTRKQQYLYRLYSGDYMNTD